MKTKKHLLGIISAVIVAVISISCRKDDKSNQGYVLNPIGIYKISIDAGYSEIESENFATRTFLDLATGIYSWTPGDQVGLYVAAANSITPVLSNLLLTGDNTTDTIHTTFTGTLSSVQAAALATGTYDYYSYFPYNPSVNVSLPSIQFSIPSNISVTPNTFDPSVFAPLVAVPRMNKAPITYSDSTELNLAKGQFLHFEYKHIISYVAIEMDCRLMSQPITSITITNNNSTQLWGNYTYNMFTGTWGYSSGGSSTLTINVTGGLTVGEDIIYIPMPPVNMSGHTFTFNFYTGNSTSRYLSKTIQGVDFLKGHIHHLRIAPVAEYNGGAGNTFDITKDGFYYIEAWGGNGGNGRSSNPNGGGKGGVSSKITGLYYFTAGSTVYVYVGSAGASTSETGTSGGNPPGGINGSAYGTGGGGGTGGINGAETGGQGGAGGAGTFIFKNGTSLPSNLLLVSGGGGGGGGRAGAIIGSYEPGNGGAGGTANNFGGNGSNGSGGQGGAGATTNFLSINFYGGTGKAGENGTGGNGNNGGGGGGGGGGGYTTGGDGGGGGRRAYGNTVAGDGGGGKGGASYLTGTIANPGWISLPNNSRPDVDGYVRITFFRQ